MRSAPSVHARAPDRLRLKPCRRKGTRLGHVAAVRRGRHARRASRSCFAMRRGECLAVLCRQQMAGHVDRVDGEVHHESRSSNEGLLPTRPCGLRCPSTVANYGAIVRTFARTPPLVGNNLETTSRVAAGRRLPRPDAMDAAARGYSSSVAIRNCRVVAPSSRAIPPPEWISSPLIGLRCCFSVLYMTAADRGRRNRPGRPCAGTAHHRGQTRSLQPLNSSRQRSYS